MTEIQFTEGLIIPSGRAQERTAQLFPEREIQPVYSQAMEGLKILRLVQSSSLQPLGRSARVCSLQGVSLLRVRGRETKSQIAARRLIPLLTAADLRGELCHISGLEKHSNGTTSLL